MAHYLSMSPKRKRMVFEDVSDDEDVKPATKILKIEEETAALTLNDRSACQSVVKSEYEEKMDVEPPEQAAPVRFEVFVNSDSKITKTNAKKMFDLRQRDFEGLLFIKWPLKTKPYTAHLYDIIEVWERAIKLKRIPRDTPRPPIVPHFEVLTMAQALARLPGCREFSDCFAPWIWRAIARFYELTLNLDIFRYGGLSSEIAQQLAVGLSQELNKKYHPWPRTTAPLRPSQSTTKLQAVLSRAPSMWAKDYKGQVNLAVDGVVTELGKQYEMAARWLVYEKLAAVSGGLQWDPRLGRWVDHALEALKGSFQV